MIEKGDVLDVLSQYPSFFAGQRKHTRRLWLEGGTFGFRLDFFLFARPAPLCNKEGICCLTSLEKSVKLKQPRRSACVVQLGGLAVDDETSDNGETGLVGLLLLSKPNKSESG